jgi:crotonobetainyl-CoA:carnitine CoA-transferase CaiB-like acyl-CoA transferase
MFETMAAFVLQEHLAQHSFDPPVGPPGDRRLLNPHNKPVQTADGWISLTVNTNAQVRAFLTAVGRTDLLDDPRFASVASRAAHVDEWFAIRGQPLTSRTTGEWLEILSRADIPVTACHTLESLPNDPHLRAVGILAHEIHPTEGATIAIRPTISFDAAYPASPEFAQPRGWETRAILQELGYSRAETDRLLAEDIVRSSNAQ